MTIFKGEVVLTRPQCLYRAGWYLPMRGPQLAALERPREGGRVRLPEASAVS